MQFFGLRVLIKRIKAIRFMMADRSVPKRKKALVIAGIIYLFLPIDLIPPILFPIAWMDDLALWRCGCSYCGISETSWTSTGTAGKHMTIQKSTETKHL